MHNDLPRKNKTIYAKKKQVIYLWHVSVNVRWGTDESAQTWCK
jgi:hypothetical protein